MKILLVTHRYPPRTGGVETHVREIATRLADRGHEVVVFSADAGHDVPTERTEDGVRIRRFRSVSPSGAFYFAPQMAIAVRRSDVDVVHAHNYHSLPLFFAALAAGDARFVATPHYHNGSAAGWRDRLLSLYRPLGGWALRRADAVVAVSEWERKQLADDFGVNATVIPNGLDIERFAGAEPADRGRPYLLCVGRLAAYKGVQHAIHALSALPDRDLVVAGSGPYRESLEAAARNAGASVRVSFLGYVDDDRLPGLYAGADAYLNLSSFEAYGMTVSEALAAGTPCVVRESGALTDWTAYDAVVGVDDVDPASVASVVASAVGRTPEISSLSTWDDVVDELESVYR